MEKIELASEHNFLDAFMDVVRKVNELVDEANTQYEIMTPLLLENKALAEAIQAEMRQLMAVIGDLADRVTELEQR